MTADTLEPLTAEEEAEVRHDLDPFDAYQYGGWAYLVGRILATLDAARAEPSGLREAIEALDWLDDNAPLWWQQSPRGQPMEPMQLLIRERIRTIRAALSSRSPAGGSMTADTPEPRPVDDQCYWQSGEFGCAVKVSDHGPDIHTPVPRPVSQPAERERLAAALRAVDPHEQFYVGASQVTADIFAAALIAASPAAPAGLDVERLARAIDDTPTLVSWRVDKGDRYEAVQVWAADIAAAYDRAASQPSEDGPADLGERARLQKELDTLRGPADEA